MGMVKYFFAASSEISIPEITLEEYNSSWKAMLDVVSKSSLNILISAPCFSEYKPLRSKLLSEWVNIPNINRKVYLSLYVQDIAFFKYVIDWISVNFLKGALLKIESAKNISSAEFFKAESLLLDDEDANEISEVVVSLEVEERFFIPQLVNVIVNYEYMMLVFLRTFSILEGNYEGRLDQYLRKFNSDTLVLDDESLLDICKFGGMHALVDMVSLQIFAGSDEVLMKKCEGFFWKVFNMERFMDVLYRFDGERGLYIKQSEILLAIIS